MKYLVLLLAIAIFLGFLTPINLNAESVFKPSMKISVYPDGSIKLFYRLLSTLEIPLAYESMYAPRGNLNLTYTFDISKDTMIHKFRGSGRIKSELFEGNLTNKLELLVGIDLAGAGNSTYGEIRGDAAFKFISYAGLLSKNISIIAKDIYIAAYKDREELLIEFTADVSGIEIPLNITKEYLNNKLRERNVNYAEFKEFEIEFVNKTYTIHTKITISIAQAIESTIIQGFISEDEGKRIKECFAKSFCEFYKLESRLLLGFLAESYEKGINIAFVSEGKLAFGTNITKFMEVNAECSKDLNKLVMFITQQLGSIQPTIPSIPTKPPEPLFQPVIPGKSSFELSVNLDVYNNTQLINVSLALETGRFRAINASLNIKGTKLTLKYLKEFILKEVMPMTILIKPYLDKMGIKGDVLPTNVELAEGRIDNVVATPIDKVIELLRLDQARIIVTTPVTPTTPTVGKTTITLITPITKTTTITKTEINTITSFKTEISSITLLTATTVTKLEREWGVTIGIGVALFVIGMAIGYAILRIRIKS